MDDIPGGREEGGVCQDPQEEEDGRAGHGSKVGQALAGALWGRTGRGLTGRGPQGGHCALELFGGQGIVFCREAPTCAFPARPCTVSRDSAFCTLAKCSGASCAECHSTPHLQQKLTSSGQDSGPGAGFLSGACSFHGQRKEQQGRGRSSRQSKAVCVGGVP